jgi:hypothetical protein
VASQPWTPFLMMTVAPAGTVAVKAQIATWGARGSVVWDNLDLTTASVWKDDVS